MFTAGGDFSATPKKKAVCGCRRQPPGRARSVRRSTTSRTTRCTARLRTPNGCATCRPAVNYYLISTWPKEAKDDPQSRFINERSHANIQKDGTYSVIPRMWGGETTADELRRIADAVDKYKIPTVKVTGGQRIDLLGVKKEDLAACGRTSACRGFAYGKSLRTVKTCVGSEWCRFGTQDDADGQDLEHALWAVPTAQRSSLRCRAARATAPRRASGRGRDRRRSGWEIYVGGNGGIRTSGGSW
jgi:nitrite reductase (NADH) large subunit